MSSEAAYSGSKSLKLAEWDWDSDEVVWISERIAFFNISSLQINFEERGQKPPKSDHINNNIFLATILFPATKR